MTKLDAMSNKSFTLVCLTTEVKGPKIWVVIKLPKTLTGAPSPLALTNRLETEIMYVINEPVKALG